MSKFLITGGRGFIGSALVTRLRSMRHEVYYPPIGTNLAYGPDCAEVFMTDEYDYIIHAADRPGTTYADMGTNTTMALNVLDCWRKMQPQAKMIGFTSLWAYPNKKGMAGMMEEDYWQGEMFAPAYGIAKKVFSVGMDTLREQGLKGTIFALGNVYGPNDMSDRVIPSLIRKMMTQNTIEIHNSNEIRDFLYIEDAISAIIERLDWNDRLINTSTGSWHTVQQVARLIRDKLGVNITIEWLDAAVPRNRTLISNMEWSHCHGISEGLDKTVEWFKEKHNVG
jgi:nucleoside-diphosphate-sugar epimerase